MQLARASFKASAVSPQDRLRNGQATTSSFSGRSFSRSCRPLVLASHAAGPSISRRVFHLGLPSLITLSLNFVRTRSTSAGPLDLLQFTSASKGYQLKVPMDWEKKDKAGADMLFEDPSRRSTSVGITVNPVRVRRIEDFGTLAVVGERLIQAELRKESTLKAEMLRQSSRVGGGGALLFEYEYDLDSTRGHKRILNTVTIFNSNLYILNGTYKCEKDGCDDGALASIQLLRDVAGSFDVN